MDTITEFWNWVDKLRHRKGYSWRKLERIADAGHGSISSRYKDSLQPTIDTLTSISKGLNISMGEVLVHAGILEPNQRTNEGENWRNLLNLLLRLSEKQRKEAYNFLSWHFESEKAENP